MSTKFKNLVTKKKSELQDLADKENINYSQGTKRNGLIIKLANDLTDKKKSLLSYRAEEIKQRAKEVGVDYSTKKETIKKIVEKWESKNSEEEKEKVGTWEEEFQKAVNLAVRRTINEEMSYKVLSTEDKNTFNVSPKYMKHKENRKVLITFNISEYAKDNL